MPRLIKGNAASNPLSDSTAHTPPQNFDHRRIQKMFVSVHPFGGSAELHPIYSITDTSIIVAEFSGRILHPDGRWELIGTCKHVRLDRKTLEAGEEIWRRHKRYKLASIADVTLDGQCVETFAIPDKDFGDLDDDGCTIHNRPGWDGGKR
jgi:hypothetical protein